MAFILTCSVFICFIYFYPIDLADFYAILTAAPFFLHSYIDVTVAYKFIVDIKCILYLCPYLVLSLLYLYACGINTYLDTSKRCIIICRFFFPFSNIICTLIGPFAGELKIIVIEFKHIFECLGLTLHYLLKST